MTTRLEEHLRAGMAEHNRGVSLTTDIVGAARRRHARRTVLLRTMSVTAVAAVVGVGAITVTTLDQRSAGPVTATPSSAAALSPEVSLAAAAAATNNTSYRMRVVSERATQGGNGWSNDDFPREGAFDPATVTGYLRTPDGRFEFRLIAGVLYAKALSDPFVRAEGNFEGMPIRLGHLGKDGITSVDPRQLVTTLRESNATITQPAPNVYHYSMTKPPKFGATLVVDGDITLDADGRIAKVTCTMTSTLQTGEQQASRVTIELWDYGVPVQVETPVGAKPATVGN